MKRSIVILECTSGGEPPCREIYLLPADDGLDMRLRLSKRFQQIALGSMSEFGFKGLAQLVSLTVLPETEASPEQLEEARTQVPR